MRDPLGEKRADETMSKHGLLQLSIVTILILSTSIGGYYWRHQQLQNAVLIQTTTQGTNTSTTGPLGDVSNFTTIGQDILTAVNANDWQTANTRVDDMESAWDSAQARLKPLNQSRWVQIDTDLDKVFREVRAVHPNQQTAQPALQKLLTDLSSR